MTDDDLCFTPATRLAALVRARKVSPLELTRALLGRIERVNPPLNAYCTVASEQALAAARAATRALTRRSASVYHIQARALSFATGYAGSVSSPR